MPSSTIKTILLVIGSGIGGILIFVAALILYYKTSSTGTAIEFSRGKEVPTPPAITEVERFLGSHAINSSDFSSDRGNVLAPGPGNLMGRITCDGKAIKGLRLRLALNGKVYSQWGISDATGKYEIAVPYAKYRIDGYELDSSTADTVLRGMTNNPNNGHTSEVMTVAEGRPGRGLDLDFVVRDRMCACGTVERWAAAEDSSVYRNEHNGLLMLKGRERSDGLTPHYAIWYCPVCGGRMDEAAYVDEV